ncbi:MAG: cyclic nucleotide-binding domain-containing protein [Dehalococcoidia bacterium]|nr:MAG: cyclic nucleotide-binding domain-containing protein [Dehalococcoidia bacterium]
MGSIKQVLARSQLFEGLADGELDKITRLCREKVYEAGATIFTEGEVAKELYIVEDGRVVLEMTIRFGPGSGRRGSIDVITKGQAFGWSAIAESHILTMSARCMEKTKVIALDGVGLRRLLEEDSHMGHKVMKRLVGLVSSRLRHARDTLAHILSIASHDLKSPLAAVESYHQVMLGGYAGEITEKQKNMLLRSSERIRELLDLIDNILDISRIDARELKMEATSLLKVVESTRGTVQPLAEEKGVQLKVEVPQELPLVTGAPDRLQQVFTNLLGNAIKFTPEGGTVALKVGEEGDHILVEVIDTGIGISPEELPRIFDDFYRGLSVNSSGAGLGLSIAKKIVEAHSGKIWVESPCPESGTGSKFTFTLPKNFDTIQGEKEAV